MKSFAFLDRESAEYTNVVHRSLKLIPPAIWFRPGTFSYVAVAGMGRFQTESALNGRVNESAAKSEPEKSAAIAKLADQKEIGDGGVTETTPFRNRWQGKDGDGESFDLNSPKR